MNNKLFVANKYQSEVEFSILVGNTPYSRGTDFKYRSERRLNFKKKKNLIGFL